MDNIDFALAFQITEDNKLRWVECFDFINGKIYYLSLNSDGKIKLKNSVIKNADVDSYFENNLSTDAQIISINKKQMEDLMNMDNYSLMKMDIFEFAKRYNLEQAMI